LPRLTAQVSLPVMTTTAHVDTHGHATTNTIRTPAGVHLAFDDVGEGPPVVLTHGWTLGGEMWEPVAMDLARAGLRAITVDRRGCGRSDRPPTGFDYDTLADDLATVIEGLDLRDITLVAHSIGGAEAVRMLARHGTDRVARLVLVASTTPGPSAGERPDAETLDAQLAPLRADRPQYLRAGVPGFFGAPAQASAERVDWALGLAARASLAASVGLMESLATTDVAPDVAACAIPALVVHGDLDASAPIELTARRTAAMLPDARLEVYAGAPHGLPLTHAPRLAQDIAAFARVAAPA
jgi:non-heme chloroperoxidase